MKQPLRFALFGAGFWARFQLAAWRELPDVVCVAICDPDRARAEALARELAVPAVFDDPERAMAELGKQGLDFVDLVSAVPSHKPLVLRAAAHRIPVICQKPLAESLDDARAMLAACREAGVPLFVHENFRWQSPIQAIRAVLASGQLGDIVRGRLDFVSGFPVFDNQPALKDAERFILADVGVHILDVARFLFGEAGRLYCQTRRIHQDIRGEDVATVCLEMTSGATLLCNMAYAGTPIENDAFPQPLVFIEGTRASLALGPGCELRITDAAGTRVSHHRPTPYAWANPAYLVVQSSIVPCNRSFLRTLQGEPVGATGATTAEDNLETLRLVDAAYRSAATRAAISL